MKAIASQLLCNTFHAILPRYTFNKPKPNEAVEPLLFGEAQQCVAYRGRVLAVSARFPPASSEVSVCFKLH